MEQQVSVLIHEGVLDAQFNELMQLQDESNFLQEVIQLYFEVGQRFLCSRLAACGNAYKSPVLYSFIVHR